MPEDRDVLRQIKAGDIDMYSRLVDAYEPAIRRYIRSRLFDRDHTDDLVQLVFIKFYKSIELFDDTRPVLPYLYAIAITELKMFFRAQKKGRVSLEQVEHTLESEQEGEDIEHQDEVATALEQLSHDQKSALLMYAEGYKYHEIAARLSKPINTIRTLIRRARLSVTSKRT
jgi:RNA polymerase sigma-70 factor (ECF subfamily)